MHALLAHKSGVSTSLTWMSVGMMTRWGWELITMTWRCGHTLAQGPHRNNDDDDNNNNTHTNTHHHHQHIHRPFSVETVEIPQLQLEFSWTSCCLPVVCNNSCLRSSQLSTVVNVPVIMRDSGNAPDSGHREFLVDIPARNRGRCSTSQWQR